MLKRISIFFASCSLVVCLSIPANAILPAVLLAGLPEAAIWGSALFHAAAIGAIAYFSLSSSGSDSHKADSSTGNIGRTANVAWVEWDNAGKQFVTMQSPASVKVPFSTTQSKTTYNPTKFPKLKSAMTYTDYANKSTIDYNNTAAGVGKTISVSPSNAIPDTAGKSYKLNSYYGKDSTPNFYNVTWKFAIGQNTSLGIISFITYVFDKTENGTDYYIRQQVYYKATQVSSVPAVTPATPSQFAEAIAPGGTVTDTAIKSEIDAMIKEYDNDNYSFNVIDSPSASAAASGSAPSLSLPAGALSSSQVSQIKASQDAGSAVSQAWKNYSSSKSPADAQKYLDAVAQKSALEAQKDTMKDAIKEADKEEAEKMSKPSSMSLPTDLQNPVPNGDYYGYLGLDRFSSVASSLSTKQPFAYLGNAKVYLNNWSDGRGAPVFSFNIPAFGVDHNFGVDLSPWDGVAKVIRYLFGISGLVGLGAYFRSFLMGR